MQKKKKEISDCFVIILGAYINFSLKSCSLIFSVFLFVVIMDVTAVTDSINKKQTNSRIKRSRSITTLNSTSKYIRTTKRRDTITSFINKINVREYFLHERAFANVKIKLSQQIIWCDKALLAAASPVLCEQFRKTNHKDEILTFDDINLDEFLLFLEFIYPLFNPEINEQNISCLIKLSHRFQFG